MIRTVKHKNGEYFIVSTYFEIRESGRVIKVPISIQVDSTALSVEESGVVYKSMHGLFNRVLILNLNKPVETKESWWNKLFKK
jgi:hypothetical protein